MTDGAGDAWAPPSHPDSPDDKPLGVDADLTATATPELPPVWVSVELTRTGSQRLPGFIERLRNPRPPPGRAHRPPAPLLAPRHPDHPAQPPSSRTIVMARIRRDRWLPPEATNLPAEARGGPAINVNPPQPVRAWLQTITEQIRVDARALCTTPDAVLVEWTFGQAATAAWVWRSAVRHRSNLPAQ